MIEIDSAFARRFREACLNNRDLPTKQEALGKKLGVSGPMISAYRSGAKMPSIPTAIRIASVTGVGVEWLLTGRGDKYPPGIDGHAHLTVDQVFDMLGPEGIAELFERMQQELLRSMADKNST